MLLKAMETCSLLVEVISGDLKVKIYDRREPKIVKTFKNIHTDTINCVRWSTNGDMLTSASNDKTAKLLDFKTGKAIYTGTTSDAQSAGSACLI